MVPSPSGLLPSTMQDAPLSLATLLRHGATMHASSEVVSNSANGSYRAIFGEVADRAARLAQALTRLGVERSDRVGTFAWNDQEHLEAYLAVPAMGSVLHTLNVRLFPEQLAYVANHAEDRVVVADAALAPVLARVLPEMSTVRHVLVAAAGADADAVADAVEQLRGCGVDSVVPYEDALAAEEPGDPWVVLDDERAAAAMCYTSGTTGNPKGVVYSHRSVWLHSFSVCSGNALGLTDRDRVLPVVPMFHANAWGFVHAAWLAGAHLALPGPHLAPEPLAAFIAETRPTVAGAVPTVWTDLLKHSESTDVDLSSLRLVACGGSAVPLSLMQRYADELDVYVEQAWGMTETSPLATTSRVPEGVEGDEAWRLRATAGRPLAGVELRVVAEDGSVLPWNDEAVGEVQVRGPWVTGAYYGDEDPAKFDDGWLRTGDVGRVDPRGYVTLTDRAKDVIKSGGEWISSVELENQLMGHPDVDEAAVVGVPDERWDERPLACVVPKKGTELDVEGLRGYLKERVASWWVPESWAVVDAVPRTSVGKFDKKVLRRRHADGELEVVSGGQPSRGGGSDGGAAEGRSDG